MADHNMIVVLWSLWGLAALLILILLGMIAVRAVSDLLRWRRGRG